MICKTCSDREWCPVYNNISESADITGCKDYKSGGIIQERGCSDEDNMV